MPKSPADYIAAILPAKGHGAQTIVFAADAEQAVAQALADSRRYHDFLSRAIRNSKPTPANEQVDKPKA